MKLINTDGLVLLGPGSEWFWTAFSGIVLAVTFLAIWRQLRLQRAATGYAQLTDLSQRDVAEPMLRMKLEILRALRNGAEPTALPYGAVSYVTDFWEDNAALVRLGHFDARMLYMTTGDGCLRWWLTLQPFLAATRVERGDPRLAENFEWLATMMAGFNRRDGIAELTLERIRQNLDGYLQNNEDRLRTAESLRTIVLARTDRAMTGAAKQGTVRAARDIQ